MNAATRKYDEWKAAALRNVDPQHTAFLVIDLQTDFCSPNGALAALGSDVSPSAAVADRIKSFLPQVREELGLVAFFKLVYEPTKMSPSQRERLLRDGKPLLCDPRTGGCDLVISPGPSDLVFSKHRYSAFTNQQFCELLVERSIQTVVVTGVDTHICVEGTVRHGYDLGYRMLVVSDLVGTRASESARHEHALSLCDRYFSILIDSRTLLTVVREASNTSTMTIDTRR
jgi:ureidoacrylate peracid hydrolase